MDQICKITYNHPQEDEKINYQDLMESKLYGSLRSSSIMIQSDISKTEQEKIVELNQKISEVESKSELSEIYKSHLVIGYEQQKLQLLLESNQARQISSIPHINQQIDETNLELLFYVLSESLRRDQGRSLLITPKSSQIGLESTLFPQASNYKYYKLHIEKGDYSLILHEETKAQFIQDFKAKVSKALKISDDQIKILDILEGSIIVHFTFLQNEPINNQQIQLLSEVFDGVVEVFNYFTGEGNNQLVGLSLEDFSPDYNMEWEADFEEKEERGPPYHRYDYYFPRGYKGYALNVLDGRYGYDDRWIAMDGNDEEWRILYHGTSHENIQNIIKQGLQPGLRQAFEYDICALTNLPVGQGVYFSDKISICEEYAPTTQVGDKEFQLIFQSRVNPRAIRQSLDMKEYNYFVVNSTKDIHPYRILLKEI